ncbi:GNAT family N-acetyltransferase [Paracoccus methylarcula]|uniref:GNAT family N-acetyltransferase n=1 Tax=Paracoccus methylarcula TaxID=72022 RepID=A0A3R7PNM1_9RHOB|nr:GNAT family N-acetyltransferase [Paracoccus methylarcula]RNF33504.1 GNAT family N-acetyltransferase [Paracoccus methylarcula]
MAAIDIRRLSSEDRQDWEALWQGYNRFYKRSVEDRVTERLWDRLIAGTGEPFGFGAEIDGRIRGFAHYFFQSSSSDWNPRCYLQDLFADPDTRGIGVGRVLIEAVYAEADRHEAAQTYWLTEDSNATARLLYDRIGKQTRFIKYMR